jgi:hypothetical protein
LTTASEKVVSALPNVVVIGTQKGGTSSLHAYLRVHPEISMSKPKELNFFVERRNWARGPAWYSGHFDPTKRVRGESSPAYTAAPAFDGVPERMAGLIPDAKLIYLVRDPIDRIASHYVHNVANGRERSTIEDALRRPRTSYVARSCYFDQLQRYLRHFPRSQVLVLESRELLTDRAATLRQVFEFLGVDPEFRHPAFVRERNVTAHKRRPTRLGRRIRVVRRGALGRRLPARAWRFLERRLPVGASIPRPTGVREALSEEDLARLQWNANQLRGLLGRDLSDWSV